MSSNACRSRPVDMAAFPDPEGALREAQQQRERDHDHQGVDLPSSRDARETSGT
jgi:hypothetical protein